MAITELSQFDLLTIQTSHGGHSSLYLRSCPLFDPELASRSTGQQSTVRHFCRSVVR